VLDLAIIIVSYNTRDVLRDCLRSVHQSRGDFSFETIVVDNCSSDGSGEMVASEFSWVRNLVECDHNGGYAYANNAGLRAVGYGRDAPLGSLPRYALLLNPDTVLPSDALAETVAFMDRHEDVGVVGPKLERQDGSLDKACRRSFPTPEVSFYRLSGLSKLFPASRRFGRYNLTYLDPGAQADVDAVVGAFMMIRSQTLEEAGLLDEAFFMYGEDLDLCFRIKERGWRVVYNPAVTVLHLKGVASSRASQRSIAAFYDAMKIFHDKHYRSRTPLPVNWAIDLGIPVLRRWALLRDSLRPAELKRVASA
jgi:N-acetylglucosaminyl-diphospho-decaprenol L-rhamnosyltransferase